MQVSRSSKQNGLRDPNVGAAFTYDSGRLCLDCAATISDRAGEALERWETPHHLAVWCVDVGLLDVLPNVSRPQLLRARLLREAIYRLVNAARTGASPDRRVIELVNEWAAKSVVFPKLASDGKSASQRANSFVEAALAAVSRDAIDLVTGRGLGKVRECAAASCSMLFVDRSRPGRRRWCSMQRCGNRAKIALHRKRGRPRTA
jgi:predicted RNA-binding Zn ribbon-like protein